jgi:hypothetical protein
VDVAREGDIHLVLVEQVFHGSLHIEANQLVVLARVSIVPTFRVTVTLKTDGFYSGAASYGYGSFTYRVMAWLTMACGS